MKNTIKIHTKLPYRFLEDRGERIAVRFNKDKLQDVTSNESSSYNLEVIKAGRIGSSFSNQFDGRGLLARAVSSAPFGDRVPYVYTCGYQGSSVSTLSRDVEKLEAKELVFWGKEIISKLSKTGALTDVFLSKQVGRSSLEVSGGVCFDEKHSSLSVVAEAELISKSDILQVVNSFSWRKDNFNLEKFVGEILQKFEWSAKIADISSGEYTIVFAPEAFSTLLDFVEMSLSAKMVYKGVSKFKDSLGKKVADSKFNLLDDPTINYALGSVSCDDEGFVCKPLHLIKQGVLENFYTDLKYAKRLKISPNGRGFGIPSSPDLTNLLMGEGEISKDKMISNVKKGLIVYQILGGGQDSPFAGDFSFNVHLGFLVENGEIVGRVKNTLVSGNVFNLIKSSISGISQERKWVDGDSLLPYVEFEKLKVTAG